MLKIKLARFGKKHQPHYRMVVTEARSKRDGKYVEKVGHYAPTQTPKILEINVVRYQYWVDKGAIPTETVAGLFKRYRSGNPFPPKKKKLSKKAKAKLKEASAETQKADNKTEVNEKAPVTKDKVEDKVKKETDTQDQPETNEEKTDK